jgi:predicted GIY-YIG superfamily endonuclease
MSKFHYVYTLQSLSHPDQHYTGQTEGLHRRFLEHNPGKVPHTSKFVPWETALLQLSKIEKRLWLSNVT